jgi:hypothetical protein
MLDSPFLYLLVCTVKNRVLSRVRRLREPKYAIGAIVGVAYLYVWLVRPVRLGSQAGRGVGLPPSVIAPLQSVAIFFLWLIVLSRWFLPVSRQPLQLSASERDFLLPAPLARRRIIRYKVLRSLVGILFSTAIITVFARTAATSAWSLLAGTFLLFATVRLHLLGIALTRATLLEGRGHRDLAALVALVVVIAATCGAVWALAPAVVHMQRTGDLGAALELAHEALSQRGVTIALLPFTVMIRPLFAAWPAGFALAAVPAVLLALANYAWVLRSEGTFEQSTGASEHEVVEGRRAPARPVFRRAPFNLPVRGRAESAIVWKNLIMLGRYASVTMLVRVAVPPIVVAVVIGASHRTGLAATFMPIAMALCCGVTGFGPYMVRNDLRQDLVRLSVLKTWPISGKRLLWGEILASSGVVSLLVALLMLIAGGLSLAAPSEALPWRDRLAVGISAIVMFPALILAQVVIQNATVVLFPGWVAVGPARLRGIEAMGQQMLMFAGTVLLLAIGVLPGALLGGLLLLFGFPLVGWLATVPATLVAATLLVGEVVLAVHFLGMALERLDPSAIDLA